MELNGKVVLVGETEVFGTNNFKKRNLVIETTDDQYPQKIQIEFVQAKGELLDGIQVGSMVKVSINLGGREWMNNKGETKYFNSITGWKIELNNTAMAEAGGDPFP